MHGNLTHADIFRDLRKVTVRAPSARAAERAYARLEAIDRELCELLATVFGREYAIQWLVTPTTALGYLAPWKMLEQSRRTDVVRVVEAFAEQVSSVRPGRRRAPGNHRPG